MAEPWWRTGHEPRFTKEHGSFYFYRGGGISYMADELALAFDASPESMRLVKHGPAEAVQAWAKDARKKYREFGMDEQADNLIVVSSTAWDPAELTKFVGGIGVVEFLQKMRG